MMKKIYFLSALSLLLVRGAFSQSGAKQGHVNDAGFNSPQHYKMVEEQHRLVSTYLNTGAFNKIFAEVLKKVNVAESDKKAFYKMVKEKYSLKDKYTIIAKINSGEISQSNIEKYLLDIKPTEYATYYQGAFLKGKSSLLENAPNITPTDNAGMESWLSSRLGTNVVMSAACGNVDYNAGNFGGWTGNYTTSTCTSPTPNTRNVGGINFTGVNVTTDQHGLCNAGNDPSVITGVLPTVSPFAGGAPFSCRLGDVLDGCGAADLQYSFVVNANNTNFTYSYAVVLYDGHAASDAPKVEIFMNDLTTGQPINCATYTIDATQGAGGANGYQVADPNNTLMYYKPWSQVYIPLLAYVGHNVQVSLISSDCNGGAHRGYCYIDFTCSPLQLLSSTPMICGGSTAILTAPPGASSYSWSTVGGSGCITSGTTSQTVAVNCAGHYQVTLGSFGSGCTLVIDTIIPGGPTGPIANFSDVPGCYTSAVPFTDLTNPNGGGPVTGWSWNFGDGGTSTTQNPNHTYAAPGTYTVTLTSTNGGCTSTYTAAVTVTAGATPSFTAPPVCLGSPTVFTNTTAGATSYTWTLGNGATSNSATPPPQTYTAAGSIPVTLSVTTSSGCAGVVTQSVIVNGPPNVTATNGGICNGAGPGTCTASGAVTYTWSTGTNGATLNQSPGSTTVYTVTGTDANGCTDTATATITVVSNPVVNVPPTTICAGSTATLTASGATSYSWSGPNIVGSNLNTSVTANPPVTSTYTVVGTVGTCTATTTGVINVNPMPVPAFVSSIECLGTPTSFTNNSTPVAGSTYNWDFGDGQTSTNASPTNTYSAAGSYVATLTVTATGGCVGTVTNNVTVKPVPVLNPVANVSVCDQNQIVVQPFVSVPVGATVGWANNNTAIGLGANGAGNIPSFTGTNGTPAAIQGVVTAIPTLNGCVGPAITFTLTVTPGPIVQLTSPPITCPGQNVPAPTYTMNPNDPNMTFAWVNNNTAVGLGANGVSIPPSFTAASNSTLANISSVVTVTPTLNGCVGPPATYTIQIYPTPVINPIANVEKCPNVNIPAINFSVLPGGGNPSFGWSNSNPSIGLTNGGVGSPLPAFTAVNSGNTSQTATITVSASLNGCPAIPIPFTIIVDPNPVAAFSASHLICVGSPMSFMDQSSVGSGFISQWAWNLDASATAFSNAQNPQYVIQPAGAHSVTETVTTDKGCTATVTEPVYINYIPLANYTGGGQGCPILTVNNFVDVSTVTAPAQVVSWNWNFGNTATSTSQSPGTVTYGNPSPVQNAVYAVSLVVSTDSGCVSTTYSNPCVTVYPHPLPGFTWGPQDPEPDIDNPVVYFFDQSQGATGQNGLQWNLGDVFLQNQQNNYTTVQNPVHTYEYYDPYVYYVTQWVQNSYGCKDSITKPIEIKPNWTFYIPNAFSPNGDGVNEGFKGTGIGIDNTTYNLWVFDRWGNMIFYTSDMEKVWDGHIQGKGGDIVQEDVYVWKVKFHDFTGKKHEYKGTVSVIK